MLLVSRERFGRYFDKKKTNPEAQNLMKRMSALEAYPSDDLMGDKEQYSYPEVREAVFDCFFSSRAMEALVKIDKREGVGGEYTTFI